MGARTRSPGPSLAERVRAGHLAEYSLGLGAKEDRRAMAAEAGWAMREGVFFDASLTSIHGESDELEAMRREDENWRIAGGGGMAEEQSINWERLWRYLAHLYLREPVARNIVNNYTHLTVGRGFNVTFERDSEQREFDEWALSDDVRFWETTQNLVASTYLFGSMFSVRFPALKIPEDRARNLSRQLRLEQLTNGRRSAQQWRIWEPHRFDDVVTAENDVKTVIAWQLNTDRRVWYDARGVIQHLVVGAGTVIRGLPLLMPSLVDIRRLEKFAEDRYWVNHARARFPLIRRFDNVPPAAIQDEANKPVWKTLPPPGSQAWDFQGGKWEFPSHNVGGGDVAPDWRLLVLRIAAGVSLPEFLVLQDASNSNFASTLVAESPAHLMFQSLQAQWAFQFDRLLDWFFEGKDRLVEPSPIIPRELEKEGRFWLEAALKGFVSLQTFHQKVGLDPTEEKLKLEHDRSLGFLPDPLALAQGLLAQPKDDGDGPAPPEKANGKGNGKGAEGARALPAR